MKMNTIKVMRYGVQDYLKEKGFDINSAGFPKSQEIFGAVKVDLKRKVIRIRYLF